MNDILSIVVASIFILLYHSSHSWIFIEIDWNYRTIMASNTENPLKTSFVFLIRHSLYGLAMFEGFRWFT